MEKNDALPTGIADFLPEAVVVGGGDYPSHPLPLHWLELCEKVVCCDGTANQWLETGRRPWRIVGDGDSLSPQARAAFADIICLNPDQETNDQTKAVDYLRRLGIRRIALLAATGRREDHALGNISLLADYRRMGLDVRMYTDHGVFIPCCDDRTFRCPSGTAVSIFSFGARHMKSEGLLYPIYDFTSWWQGTLNQTTAETFRISCQGEYLVFLNYENEKIRR